MAKFVYEGKTKEQFNKHQLIAMRNIKYAFNWIVGGYYNCIQDGYEEALPKSRKDLENEIYSSALDNLYGAGAEIFGRAPREMRFAGETFCRAYINFKLDNDGDVKEIAEIAKWERSINHD